MTRGIGTAELTREDDDCNQGIHQGKTANKQFIIVKSQPKELGLVTFLAQGQHRHSWSASFAENQFEAVKEVRKWASLVIPNAQRIDWSKVFTP